MKVSEAKEKVCPFMSFVSVDDHGYFNCKTNCICGDCMAWVWSKEEEDGLIECNDIKVVKYKDSTTDGYCSRLSQ